MKVLTEKWNKITKDLESCSKKQNKKIIFTEFGYKSVHHAAWNQWEVEGVRENENVNQKAQVNAYSVLFESVWNKPWFGGGFLWKWYAEDTNSGGLKNSDYTPQHKPVEEIIQQYYTPNLPSTE